MIRLIPADSNTYDGTNKFYQGLLKGLSKKVEVEVSAVPKIEVNVFGRKMGGWASVELISRFRRYDRDLVHVVSHWLTTSYTHIATVHDMFMLTRPNIYHISISDRQYYGKIISRMKNLQAIVTDSNFVKDDIQPLVPDVPISVIPIGVPGYDGVLQNPYREDGKLHLITMGEIYQSDNRKRIPELYSYVANNSDVDLYHIGRIEDKRYINYAKNIHYVGSNVPEHVKWSYLKYADKFVFFTHAEGQGIPAMEAARINTQPVLNDIPVHREFFGDKAYYFTDKDSFFQAIYKPKKSGLVEQIARYDDWIDRYIDLYTNVKKDAVRWKHEVS